MTSEKKVRKEDPVAEAWHVARAEGWSKLLSSVPKEMLRQYVEFLDARDVIVLLERVVPQRLEAIKPQWMSYIKEVSAQVALDLIFLQVTIRRKDPLSYLDIVLNQLSHTLETLNIIGVTDWAPDLTLFDFERLTRLRKLVIWDCAGFNKPKTLCEIWAEGSQTLRVLHVNCSLAWRFGDSALTMILLGRHDDSPNMSTFVARNPNMIEIVIPFIQLIGCWRLLLDGGGPRLGLTANHGKHIRHLTRLELGLPSHPHVLETIGRCCPHMQTLALLGNHEADNSWDAADLRRLTTELKELRDLTLFAQDVRTHW
jgi:hypothetical protein